MTFPQPATQVLKVTTIDDLGLSIIDLPAGTYLIDGETVTHGGFNSYNSTRQISAKDVENVRSIHTQKVLVGYSPTTEGITDDILSVESYNDFIDELNKAGHYDEISDEFIWDSLDGEFAYRKFKSQLKAMYKEVVSYSEPLLVDRSHIRQDSGNPYIRAGFLTGRSDVPLYSYSRTNAVADLLARKFESLGMEFKEGVSYSGTEGKKVWGNSTHSGLEYVTAFGKYIIGKQHLPKTRGEFKGSFEYLENIYKEDKKWVEDLIQVGYNLHFRNEGPSTILLSEIHSDLKTCISYVNTMDCKVKSETSKRSALGVLNKLLDKVVVEALE